MRRFVCAVAVCLGILAGLPANAATRPVKAEDLFKLPPLSSAVISWTEPHIAYVVSKLDGPKNTYLTNIWVADVASGPHVAARRAATATVARLVAGRQVARVRQRPRR